MADTTFTTGTIITSNWLNEVNDHLYHDTPVSGTAVHTSDAISFLQDGTGASTSVTVQDKLREVVSVLDFGADNTGATDSRTAVQAAIDAVKNAGGGVVFFPEGTYKLDSSLSIAVDWPIELRGVGIEATHLNYTASDDAINMRGTVGNQVVKCGITNMRISGNGTTSVNGVDLYYGYSFFMHNVRIYNFTVGIRIEQTWKSTISHCTFDSNSGNGVELHTEANNINFIGCEFLDNVVGFYAAGARAVNLIGCGIEANTSYGAHITASTGDTQSENIVFQGCYIEGNTTSEIYVDLTSGATAPQNVIVRDCFFVCLTGQANIGVRVDAIDTCIVEGCDFSTGTATYAYSLYITDSATVPGITFGRNRDASTNGVYRGTNTAYTAVKALTAKAWGTFSISGGVVTVISSFGISSVSRTAAGTYQVTLREAMPSATAYCVVIQPEVSGLYYGCFNSVAKNSSTQFTIYTASDLTTLLEVETVDFVVYSL